MKKAIKLINKGGTIIYSTCSILKDENEKILEKVKDLVEIVPIEEIKDKNLKYLKSKNESLTIFPNSYYEGFFISKLKRL